MKSIIFLFGFGILEITAKSAARYYCNPLSCGDAYVSMGYNTQYYFSSPGYPNPYPTGTECLWSITSPFSTALRLQCYFDTRPSSNCYLDPFFFSPSGDCWMNDGRVYCGFGYLDVTTQSNFLAVRFYSYASNSKHQGFSCLVSVINPVGIYELLTPDPNPPTGPSSLTSPFVTSTTSTPETYSSIISNLTSSTTLLKTSIISSGTMPPTSSGTVPPTMPPTSSGTMPPTFSGTVPSTMPPTSSGTVPPTSSGTMPPTMPPTAPSTPAANATNAPTGIPNNSSCDCGIKGTSRIVGGNEAEPLEWPWQARLSSSDGNTFCGGSLISYQWVVTAAHCVEGRSASQFFVILGDHDTSVTENSEQQSSVDDIIIHENYDSITVDNDIALIRLNTPVGAFTDGSITPICLPGNYGSEDFIQETATVTGWGTLQFQGVQSSVLMEVDLPIVDCQDFEIIADDVTDNMICTYELGKDACQGDSGGPLQVQLEGKHSLVGVVSFGHGCGALDSPGVYTKVINYVDWIENTTGETFCY